MTESNKQILELIKLNASLNEISEITGLSNKQIFYRLNQLKNQGYSFQKKYYYTGDIVYNLENSIKKELKPLNEATILTSEKDKNIIKMKKVFITLLTLVSMSLLKKSSFLLFIFKSFLLNFACILQLQMYYIS